MNNKVLKSLYFSKIFISLILIISISTIFFVSCQKETRNKNINLFNTKSQMIEQINLEKYLEGVVAAEIGNSAPLEALKAQAVLARTFTLNFLENSKSSYEGADISTDINEAQAYNSELINDNIKKAVSETAGIFISKDNKYINAWFHSNSGGQTSLAKDGLNTKENYPYIKSIKTGENSNNTKNYNWNYTFNKADILKALKDMNVSVSSISSFNKGKINESGRCSTFIVGGKEISANTFRLKIGSTKFKSTLINSIIINNNTVTFSGQGYGHGVGLSQEYAIVLANEGKSYKEIINYFFENVKISNSF